MVATASPPFTTTRVTGGREHARRSSAQFAAAAGVGGDDGRPKTSRGPSPRASVRVGEGEGGANPFPPPNPFAAYGAAPAATPIAAGGGDDGVGGAGGGGGNPFGGAGGGANPFDPCVASVDAVAAARARATVTRRLDPQRQRC
jgi:hypothetical protein